MRYIGDMASDGMTFIPSFMKIGIHVQAILRFSHRNLKTVMLVLLMGGIFALPY
jgi:hypothetical protein